MASTVSDFWLQEKSPLLQTYEKHPTKFHIKYSGKATKGMDRLLTRRHPTHWSSLL